MADFDLVLRGLTIYDGLGNPPIEGDVAICGARIAAVGEVSGSFAQELNLEGLCLAPGFIDVHTHDDFAAVLYPDMTFKVKGGVTTCIVGNCGMGVSPYAQAMAMARAMHPNRMFPEWEGFGEYMDYLDYRAKPSVNIGVLAGHGTIRLAILGRDTRAPRSTELRLMKGLFQEGLDAGVLGLSSGLIYDPGRYATTLELIELCTLMRGTRALYTTHMRDEGAALLQSVKEAIEIGQTAQVPVQISHHKASGKQNWGLVSESLKLIEGAQQKGLQIHADQYPYTAGSTILSAIVQHQRERMKKGGAPLDGSTVVIASTERHQEWEGLSLAALGEMWNVPADEAAERVLEEEPGTTIVQHSMSEDDVRTVMNHPSTMIGSDGLPTLDGKPHPRLYNTFARVLGHYSRELGLMPLETALHKMTGLSAAKFHLVDRGEIREGAFADLVAFRADEIIDRGTFEDPNQYPDGIVHVFVNGQQVIASGEHTGARPGNSLRRVD